jgi:hypothetical protein
VAQIGHQYQKKKIQKIESLIQLGAKKVRAKLTVLTKLEVLK